MNANYRQVKLYRDALLEFIESGHDTPALMVELKTVDKWLASNRNRVTFTKGETLEIPNDLKMIER